ncbi:MAG: hypothetical protein LBL06_05845 [Treponema sp.]|jgi:hypothetical protein|nr:hypothetical protein [Treponema sp.]
MNPSNAESYLMRGAAYGDKEKYDRSQPGWERVLQINLNYAGCTLTGIEMV